MTAFILRTETVVALMLAWGFVHLAPLRWIRGLFGEFSQPGDGAVACSSDLVRAQAVAWRLTRVADRLPWHSTCLVRAMAGSLLLSRRRIRGARIRFGVRKEGELLSAHAWLMLGSEILLGGEGVPDFKPLADLGR
ncbi:MAG TPA: lasso peptide biosynthesis B2 protein [Magnetospirillum sp.]|nr:lasso peptide biosynthesis B2 protein [Magnetospirillum sp.]